MSRGPVEPSPHLHRSCYSHAALLATCCTRHGCNRPAPFVDAHAQRVCGQHALEETGSDTRQNPAVA